MNSGIWFAPWWGAAYADGADMLETLGLPSPWSWRIER
jgi:hypothetical protein